jgi:uncharacterized membrane protein SirB2
MFMRIRRTRLNTLAVIFGTVSSVIVMIVICLFLNRGTTEFAEWAGSFRLAGLVPVMLGIIAIFRKLHTRKREKSTQNHWLEASGIGVGAFLAYLGNSTDDIVVNTSLLLSGFFIPFEFAWWGFLAGIVIGSLITCGVAYLILRCGDEAERRFAENKAFRGFSKLLPYFVDSFIILVGLAVLAGAFSFR